MVESELERNQVFSMHLQQKLHVIVVVMEVLEGKLKIGFLFSFSHQEICLEKRKSEGEKERVERNRMVVHISLDRCS